MCKQVKFKTLILISSHSDHGYAHIIVRRRVAKVRHGSDVAPKVEESACQNIAWKNCTVF